MMKGNTMGEISFRILGIEDVENHKSELTELLEITLKDNFIQNYPDSLAADYVSKIPGYLEDGSAIVIGAFSDDLLVGFIWGYVTHVFDETRVHSYMGAVNPCYRGRHIAQTLMEMQFKEAENRGIYIVEAMVTVSNQASYNWHLKTGFVDERIKMKKIIR